MVDNWTNVNYYGFCGLHLQQYEKQEEEQMRRQRTGRLASRQMAFVGVMTSVTCVLGPFTIPLPFSPVPISFVNLTIYLAVYVLGARLGTVSCLLYILLGILGLPVLSGFSGGLGKVAGPTGGYLLAYPLLAFAAGYLIDAFPGRRLFHALGMLLGLFICYGVGTIWLARQLHVSFEAALAVGVLPYLIGDVLKIAAALYLGPRLRKGLRSAAG